MLITTIRYGRTVNIGNYESERLEVEAQLTPGSGETEAQVLSQLREYVDAEVGCNSTVERKAKGPAKTAPPLADKPAATQQAAPQQATPAPKPETAKRRGRPRKESEPAATAPAVDNKKEAAAAVAEAVKGTTLAANMKRGMTDAERWQTEHYKELRYALDSETLEELAERFNNLRMFYCLRFHEPGEYRAVLDKIGARFNEIVTANPDAPMELKEQIKAAGRSERAYLETGFRHDDDPLFLESQPAAA